MEKIQFFQKNDIDDTTFDKMSTYEGIKKNHLKKLEQLWKIYNITLSITDQKIITAIHFNILQMIMNIPHNCVDGNIASRGLSSEYHSGHYFFNSELFKNPYFLYTEPRISKSMINFRKKTLNNAIRNAKEMGYDGARYPEEVDDYGNAAGPTIIESTLEDKVIEEWTGRKSHFIGGFVIYSIEKYLAVTDDYSILQNGGLDLVLEVCKFYVSLLKYSKVDNLYHIDNCIGVDEYHIGINDSFLVNYMAKYVIEYTLSLLENLYDNRDIDEIMNKHNINNENISKWRHISSKIYLSRCFNNVYEEFKGYFDLKDELVLNDFKNRPNISTKINYISQNLLNCDSKVIKQSDVVLLLALFVDKFSLEKITSSLLYYDQRTIHESSLSTVHTALLYLYINNFDKAFHYFKLALYYDLNFYPKSNYNNGIHLASASGSLLLIYEGFLGIKIHKNYIRFSPKLNTFLNMIKVPIVVRDKRFFIKIEKLSNEYLLKIYDSDEVYLRKIHFKNDVIIKIEEIINL